MMNTTKPDTTIETMFAHLPKIRAYAARAIIDEEVLSDSDIADSRERLQAFMETGESLNWTTKEMVTLILREVFAQASR